MKNEKPNKLLSIKFWITLWAMVVTTIIVFTNRVEFNNIAQWLCTVPLAYMGANVYQKKLFEDKDECEKQTKERCE